MQGLQVLGTLLPRGGGRNDDHGHSDRTRRTTLNGQQEIVILAATTQQAEIIKFNQMDGNISLVLRSAADCRNADGTPAPCASATTTGITLRVLVDTYGVLPPQVVEVIEPKVKAK